MKRVILIICAVLLCVSVRGQGTARLLGTVSKNPTGNLKTALYQAEVKLKSDNKVYTAQTDYDGSFEFAGLPAGVYELSVTAPKSPNEVKPFDDVIELEEGDNLLLVVLFTVPDKLDIPDNLPKGLIIRPFDPEKEYSLPVIKEYADGYMELSSSLIQRTISIVEVSASVIQDRVLKELKGWDGILYDYSPTLAGFMAMYFKPEKVAVTSYGHALMFNKVTEK